MSSAYIPKPLRQWLESLGEFCEYCQTSEHITGIVLHAEHINPRSKDGATTQDNLCRACSPCNIFKSEKTEGADPQSGQIIGLFHPRLHRWSEHFEWSDDGTEIVGLTPIGRATVDALKLNNPRIVRSRELWVSVGWHPPDMG